MARAFEEDVLLWALDGDSVNNLVSFAQRERHMDCEAVLNAVRDLSRSGSVQVYVLTHPTGAERDVDPQEITADLLAQEPYILLTKTDRTLERLSEVRTGAYF